MIARFLLAICGQVVLAGLAARVSAVPAAAQGAFPPPVPIQVAGQPDLELRISGPKVIHRGDHIEFKATLINRSSVAVLIGPSERSRELSFSSWWDATDASGESVGQEMIGYC